MLDKKSYIFGLTLGLTAGIALGALNGINLYRMISDKVIPSKKEVQQGYIAPSRLEIQCKDLDGDGVDETIINVDDKPYLLREVDRKPVISAYKIKPAEVIPQ